MCTVKDIGPVHFVSGVFTASKNYNDGPKLNQW